MNTRMRGRIINLTESESGETISFRLEGNDHTTFQAKIGEVLGADLLEGLKNGFLIEFTANGDRIEV